MIDLFNSKFLSFLCTIDRRIKWERNAKRSITRGIFQTLLKGLELGQVRINTHKPMEGLMCRQQSRSIETRTSMLYDTKISVLMKYLILNAIYNY